MRCRKLLFRAISHLATASTVLLVSVSLTSHPFDRVFQPAQTTQFAIAPAFETEPQFQAAALVRQPAASIDVATSSRGGQRYTAAEPTSLGVENCVKPTPTLTTTPIPASASTPYPTATPTTIPIAHTQDLPSPSIRVGIQVGHWKNSELPAELASLRGSTGAAGNGWREVDINLDISKRVSTLLQSQNIMVDLIPATVPIRYKADAFVAIHGDANSNTSLSGYKLARASWSRIPNLDDALLNAISAEYSAATGLKNHPATITKAMTAYYAFNQQIQHAVDASTPAVILELGFLTTLSDRKLLMEQPDRAAEGVAKGILRFLGKL